MINVCAKIKYNWSKTIGWLVVLGFNATRQLGSYHGRRWCICVSWLSHTSTNTTSPSKATNYFSHMLLQEVRGENTPARKVTSTGIKLTTTRFATQNYQYFVHRWTLGWTLRHGHTTERHIPVYPQKTFVLRGYICKLYYISIMVDNTPIHVFLELRYQSLYSTIIPKSIPTRLVKLEETLLLIG